mgnify:CR=1 FL=1
MSDLERLELYEKLERAEGRIVALEKQVKPGDIKENFKMDDSNDDSVLFGNIARSHSTRAVDYRYKSWGTYGFYWKVNRVPHVQFSLKEKKSVPHVLFSL